MERLTGEQSKLINKLGEVSKCFVPHGEHGRLIVFEGIPGAGKTSVLEGFISRIDVLLVPELNHLDLAIDSSITSEESDVDDWYLQSELDRQSYVKGKIADRQVVIQDRNLLSLLSYFYSRSMVRGEPYQFLSYIDRLLEVAKQRLLRPDLVIFFHVNWQVSLRR